MLVSPESKQSYLESIVSRYQIHRQGSSESSAAIYFLNLCHYNACDKASDALKAGKRELNLRRRESLKPDLNVQFASLCNHATLKTSALFGYDLGKEIDEVSRANKLSRKLSSKRSSRESYHPYNTQHRQTSSLFSRGGKSYSARPFLRGDGLPLQERRSKAINIPLQQGGSVSQVGYISSIDSIIRSDAPFKAGQSRNCFEEWQSITSEPFLLQCVSNCELEFS